MDNRFVFIAPFRNVKDYIKKCADSIIYQNYKNWIAIFCDDESSDGTTDHITHNEKFIIKKNEKRITALANIHYGIINSNLNDDDVICILDGDDFLIRPDTLDILNNLYQDDTLLTYGQYVWPTGQIGHCSPYTKESFKRVRSDKVYVASHIRTFKYKLYKEIMIQDPNLDCYKNINGEFYTMTYDLAIMLPLMEICGFDKIKFNPIPVYYYRTHNQNDHAIDIKLQFNIAEEIYKKNNFIRIF